MVMMPSNTKTQRLDYLYQFLVLKSVSGTYHAANPLFPFMPAIIADCIYPENIVPTYAAHAKIAVRLPISVLLYQEPSTYCTPTKQLPSRNPIKNRIG